MSKLAYYTNIAILAVPLLGAASCPPKPPPPPTDPCEGVTCPTGQHCEGGQCVDDPLPPCPELPLPWCHEVTPPMHCGACKHQPPGDRCPSKAPDCPPTDPCTGVVCPPGSHCEAGACKPDGPPPPAGCVLAGDPGPPLQGYSPRLGAQVNAAMSRLAPGCDIGGRCVLEMGRQDWQAKVAAAIREAGLCAGQHSPGTDELAVAVTASSAWEGWHVYAGPEAGPGTVVWSPQAARGAYAAPAQPEGPCPAPTPPPDHLVLRCRWHNGRTDCTPTTDGSTYDYCAAIGMGEMGGIKRGNCPARSDCPGFQCQYRSACEQVWTGGLRWEVDKGSVVLLDNPMQASCSGCSQMRACANARPVCSDWVSVP